MHDVPGWFDQSIRMPYLRSGDLIRVIAPGQILNKSDQIAAAGLPTDVGKAMAAVDYVLSRHLASDRSVVKLQSSIVSRSRATGSIVTDLNLTVRLEAVVTCIEHGDIEALVVGDKIVELNDRLFVVYPREEERNLTAFFGDSRNSVIQVDVTALGLGITCGVLSGMAKISLPGGSSFQLSSAVGPSVASLILGYL